MHDRLIVVQHEAVTLAKLKITNGKSDQSIHISETIEEESSPQRRNDKVDEHDKDLLLGTH
jgi:hypothetical protein